LGIKEEVGMIEDDEEDSTSEASKIWNSNSDDDKSDLAMLNALIQTMDPVRYSICKEFFSYTLMN
jgi:hypothetical protein